MKSETAVISPNQTKSSLKAVKLLLPVWGARYVKQFLEFTVPTLMAPGNVPALAEALPCEFEILTSAEDELSIRQHPAFLRLSEICSTSIRCIDHLITARNYSTTITLAYTEAVRATGSAMVDTCFFFLVSDYIIANGSLSNVLSRMQGGSNAVLVGNFQVSIEDALSWLRGRLAAGTDSLVLPPRELMRWSLDHLHPATVANIVNNPLSHNGYANRLFWRVDADTLLGRFYLMHMICIRPEVTDFQIGASCDYSFIPEMCPSGNVSMMTDSDDYLVVEMQPANHESRFLRPGALPQKNLAKALSQWTTERHRKNANHSIVFHAGDQPASLAQSIAQADSYVRGVGMKLRRKPQPHRGHPYWLGAIAAFRESRGEKLTDQERLWLRERQSLHSRLIDATRSTVFGKPPLVYPWHPRWPDYRLVLRRLQAYIRDQESRMLAVSDVPTPFTLLMSDYPERSTRVETSVLLKSPATRYKALAGTLDVALLEVAANETAIAKELIDKIAPMMKPDGKMLLLFHCQGVFDQTLTSLLNHQTTPLQFRSAWISEAQFVPDGAVRQGLHTFLARLGSFAHELPWIGLLPLLILFTPLMILIFVVNMLCVWNTREGLVASKASSMLMVVTAEPQCETVPAAKNGAGTREPQYNRCLEVKQEIGLTSLGLMTNQVWHDDPRRLTFVLARYKFVAKMLSGRASIGELGCGDAFGSRIVLQEVGRLTTYDFDPIFIEDIHSRRSKRWRHEATVHDILSGPLPQLHDGIYSLDVMEHISVDSEQIYLKNLCKSLEHGGTLIIGTPSLESQSYASPSSKIGHINCKSAPELKELLERYFHSVFIFSMNDEVVHTGFYPLAHYLFALCTHRKEE
jgi:hypothetical protein